MIDLWDSAAGGYGRILGSIPGESPNLNDESDGMTENEIHAQYMQMLNSGQNAVWELGGNALTLSEWRDRELAKLKSSNNRDADK